MKKYKQAALSIAFLTFVFSGGLTTGYIGASRGTDNKDESGREEIILDCFENDDYYAWKKYLPKKSKIQNIISKADFEKFISVRKLARRGEYDEAIELSKKLEDKIKQDFVAMLI